MESEPRMVNLPPKAELRIMKIRVRQAGIREGLLMAGVGFLAVELVAFIAWLVATVNSDPILNNAPEWTHWCKWVELAVAVLAVLVMAGAGLRYWGLETEKQRLSQQREPFVLTKSDLQQLAARLEAACDTALTEASGFWDDILLILQLRYQGYTQLIEAQADVQVEDSFTKTLDDVEAVRVRLVQLRQTTALAN